jgi:hypothetical protein
VALPIQFSGIASWIEGALKADEPKAPGVSFADAHAALARFTAEAARVERARATIRSATQAGPINLWLMRTRKDLLPWVVGRGAGGVRTTAYANQVQTLASARASAERGDGSGTATAIGRMLGPGARVSRETFHDQRLYSYTSGDWSSLFEQRAKPIGPELYDIYQRLQAGGDAAAEVGRLTVLQAEAHARLSDALFLVTGKLNQAARALAETPLP